MNHDITLLPRQFRALIDGTKTLHAVALAEQPKRFSLAYEARWSVNAIPDSREPGNTQWSFWEGPSHGQSQYDKTTIPFSRGQTITFHSGDKRDTPIARSIAAIQILRISDLNPAYAVDHGMPERFARAWDNGLFGPAMTDSSTNPWFIQITLADKD